MLFLVFNRFQFIFKMCEEENRNILVPLVVQLQLGCEGVSSVLVSWVASCLVSNKRSILKY